MLEKYFILRLIQKDPFFFMSSRKNNYVSKRESPYDTSDFHKTRKPNTEIKNNNKNNIPLPNLLPLLHY